MKLNVEIDEKLLKKAMTATGAKNRKELIEKGLAGLIEKSKASKFLALRGKVEFHKDYDYKQLRRNRFPQNEEDPD